jgi:leucyl/phenylalanyl-tRNA---protein transferase
MSATNLPSEGTASEAAERGILFREGIGDRLRRNALGLAWALKPDRASGFLPGLARVAGDALFGRRALPDPQAALAQPEGLCGLARDLEPETLLAAYRRSLFPFAHVGPYKWWSPAERNVLFFDEFHMQKLVRRLMRNKGFTVTFDRAFDEVVAACAERRAGKYHLTWIRPQIMHAFARLHDLGHAHSFEVWNERGELAHGEPLRRVGSWQATADLKEVAAWEPGAKKMQAAE